MYENDLLTEKIIGLCFKIHSELGPGFPERIYQNALKILLDEENIHYKLEKEYEVIFHNRKAGKFRCDLIIEQKVIVELKSVESYMPKLFENQVLAYMKVTGIKTGLLINFGGKSCNVRRLSLSPQKNKQSM
jgi:GxxExxY protein